MFQATTATRKVMSMRSRIRGVQGGTSASKTISILLWLIHLAQSDEKPTLTSVVSESFPHLRKGAMRDFLMIMEAHGYYSDARWSKTDYTYEFETGSKIEFFSADQPGKVRGPRRDRLFVNEANNVSFEAFDQLEVRTKELVYLDWNPTGEFWFDTEVYGKRPDAERIILTYRDNEALDPEIVKSIETRKGNARWWRVYGEGLVGEQEDRIYTGWQIVESVPHEARIERRGLDFGYTNDPSAIVAIYKYNGGYILDQEAYRKGMTNRQIADTLLNLPSPDTLVIADSAEPKSIDEIRSYGVPVIPAAKGPGSRNQGIQYVQGQRISVTSRSVDLIREYRNYMWLRDREGRPTDEPDHMYSHSMDAIRYGFNGFLNEEENEQEFKLYAQRYD